MDMFGKHRIILEWEDVLIIVVTSLFYYELPLV